MLVNRSKQALLPESSSATSSSIPPSVDSDSRSGSTVDSLGPGSTSDSDSHPKTGLTSDTCDVPDMESGADDTLVDTMTIDFEAILRDSAEIEDSARCSETDRVVTMRRDLRNDSCSSGSQMSTVPSDPMH